MKRYSNASNVPNLGLHRRQLEQLWQLPAPATKPATSRLKTFGTWLLKVLTEGDQLQVWTENTPQGSYWYVQDPRTQQRSQFDSEEGVIIWLERRYSQK